MSRICKFVECHILAEVIKILIIKDYSLVRTVNRFFHDNLYLLFMDTLKVTYTDNTMNNSYMATLRVTEGQKGRTIMIDALYNYRQSEIHSAEFSDEFNKLCIPFEDSLSEEQIDVFHKILDCVSETAAAEMRAAYKAGFKDGATMMQEIQD